VFLDHIGGFEAYRHNQFRDAEDLLLQPQRCVSCSILKSASISLKKDAFFIDVISCSGKGRIESSAIGIIKSGEIAFRENYQLLSWNVVFLDCLSNNDFRQSLKVNDVVCNSNTFEYMSAVSQVWIPASHAALRRGNALSSSRTQSAQLEAP
jgi:hypothetical protein